MKLIIVTPPVHHPYESSILKVAFELGVDRIHIRKPHITPDDLKKYLNLLDTTVIQKSSIHYYENLLETYPFSGIHYASLHRKKITNEENIITDEFKIFQSTSFHHYEEINTEEKHYDYAFCSPVYPSISKRNHQPTFDWNLHQQLKKGSSQTTSLIALGGITCQHIEDCKDKGFQGVAILGSLWKHQNFNDTVQTLKKIKTICDHLS